MVTIAQNDFGMALLSNNGRQQVTAPKFNQRQKAQAEIMTSAAIKFHLAFGGRRAGKSFVFARFLIVRAMTYANSYHGVFRKTFTDCKTTVWRETYLPMLQLYEKAGICRIYEQAGKAVFSNGSVIQCGSLAPHEIDKYLGVQYATCHVVEASEVRYEMFEKLRSGLNSTARNQRGQMIVSKMVVDENPPNKQHWTYQLFILKKDPKSTAPVEDPELYDSMFFSPHDNEENLAPDYIKTALQGLTGRQRQRLYLGEFTSAEGLALPQFDPGRHIIYELPKKSWKKFYRGIDFGWKHPTACLWAVTDEDENLYIIAEHRESGWLSAQNADAMHETSVRIFKEFYPDKASQPAKILQRDAGELFLTLADHQSEYRNQYAEYGIHTERANKALAPSIDAIAHRFESDKVFIMHDCAGLIEELTTVEIKKKRFDDGFKEELQDEGEDLLDCMRYIVNEIDNVKRLDFG